MGINDSDKTKQQNVIRQNNHENLG